MQIVQLTNNPVNTPFAPTWNYFILECEDAIPERIINEFKNFILDKEKEIIEISKSNYDSYNSDYGIVFDGDTGLGPTSLTSRSPFYNLFRMDIPCVQEIRKTVLEKYNRYFEILNIPQQDVWIQSWANVMRKGESISEHIHASHENTWIGGQVTIACEDTSTFYKAPVRITEDQIYESKNYPGKLTLFPDCIPHWTNVHNGESERISIAFDIITNERHEQLSESRKEMYVRFNNE
jgi:hypothetical protein